MEEMESSSSRDCKGGLTSGIPSQRSVTVTGLLRPVPGWGAKRRPPLVSFRLAVAAVLSILYSVFEHSTEYGTGI